jgi:DNA-binding NtrC family response regulator
MTTVLLVDDDPTVVSSNAAALAAAGHVTRVATTSIAALVAIHEAVPDAVVLEGLLDGGRAGFELARRLFAGYPGLPLIMLTRADDVLPTAERSAQDRDGGWLPVHRFLEKPVMPEVLVYEVEHLLHELGSASAGEDHRRRANAGVP